MKPLSFLCLLKLFMAVLLCGTASVSHADTSGPMFAGPTLEIHGQTFAWESASEDGTWHYDTYSGNGESVTVTGMVGFTSLATVSGIGIDGHFYNGAYADNHQEWSEEGSFDNNGYYFTHYYSSTSYYPDLVTGQLLSYGSYTYSGPAGSYTYTWDASGGWSWSQDMWGSETGGTSPFCSHPSFELFGTTYSFTHNDSSWSQSSGGDSTPNTWSNGSSSSWTDHYASADGGSLSISSSQYTDNTGVSMSGDTTISGWDPLAGSFHASQMGAFSGLQGFTWEPRTAPSFAPAQLWLNGTLVNWQWGEITTVGMVTDHYEQDGLMLEIVGHAREFQQGTSDATVTVNGGSPGTLDGSGFSGTGWSIQTYEPEPEPNPDPDPGEPEPDPNPPVPNSWVDSSPFFTGTTSLWVDGTEYPFVQGYQDDTGHRTDTYENPSAGTVTLIGSTNYPNYADAQISHYGSIEYGYYYNAWFQTYIYSVSTSAPSEPAPEPDPGPGPYPVYGPDAFWVRGQLYSRVTSESNTFQSATDHELSLSSPDGGNTLQVSGTDATGSFAGDFSSSEAGIHLIGDDQGQQTVPVIPANSDGSLQLPGASSFAALPPAIMVSGRGIWQHLGTRAHDGAYMVWYGSALNISSSESTQGGGQLLSIRIDFITVIPSVTMINYLTGNSASGSYSFSSHLFQTGVENSLPMPIYGVDPTANHTLWGMAQPESGQPATFLVGDAVWRFIGEDENGAAIYQGYFEGQQLALGLPDAEGLVLVRVTDPVRGNTTGTLNGVRGSARLRNGTMVYSGDMQGARLQQTLNDYQLHTIAADLDLVGNNLSFGVLQGDASLAGALFQFTDLGGTATLHSILSREQAQWGWWKAAGTDGNALSPVMWLGADHRLSLFKEADAAAPAIVLDPAGTSSFQGPVRVPQSGDIPMGIYQEGDPP